MASTAPKQGGAVSASPNGHMTNLNGVAPLVMLAQPRSAAAEAYRTLRLNVQFPGAAQGVRAVAVTSPGPNEGKSTTLANLAIAAAEGGHRVIAVDADLRRPALHGLFGLPNHVGLTDAIHGDIDRLPLQETAVPGLLVLSSGPLPPNPSELLASRQFDRVMDVLRDASDLVLVDTPPATGVSDAALLAARVDGVLLVVSAGRTRRDLAVRAKEQLQRIGAHVLGVVLTGVRPDGLLEGY